MRVSVVGPSPGPVPWEAVVSEDRSDLVLADELTAVVDAHDGSIRLWIREVDPSADRLALAHGFVPYRDLWQLRCPLPLAPAEIPTRSFTDADIDDFVRVNNRAFHWHPEQGGLTAEQVRTSMAEPWFDADGFRLHHDDGALVGFCWTKIHAEHDPPLGEIYVIAVDPDHHGKGLGKPMTLAGLEWLADRGLVDGMLYVESDNDAATATYASLGFRRHHTDRAYLLER